MSEERVILVDEDDRPIGTEEKLAAHHKGLRHRAFSIIIVNDRGEMLLQKRADGKYHSGGLWTNTCCGHPRPGESIESAARRRLQEEMGFTCPLEERFTFAYRAELDQGLVENELDHVFVGHCDGARPQPDPHEVGDWRWVDVPTLRQDVAAHPERYTYWFRILLDAWIEMCASAVSS